MLLIESLDHFEELEIEYNANLIQDSSLLLISEKSATTFKPQLPPSVSPMPPDSAEIHPVPPLLSPPKPSA